MFRTDSMLRTTALASMLTLFALGSGAGPGEAATRATTLRAGAVIEGPQHSMGNGFEFGVSVENVTGGRFDWGGEVGYANDPGGDEQGSSFMVGGLARTSLTRRRTFVEVGLGYYWVTREAGSPAVSDDASGFGGHLGAGVTVWKTPFGTRLLAGAAYHLIAADASADGGDMGDYFTVSVSLRFGVSGQ